MACDRTALPQLLRGRIGMVRYPQANLPACWQVLVAVLGCFLIELRRVEQVQTEPIGLVSVLTFNSGPAFDS